MDIDDLKIDPEFSDLIPPLTDEEYEQLEANILSEGEVISPLIVWGGIIVDGHNRYRIIQAHPEIKYTVRQKTFADKYEAITWICQTQLGRRNLTERQKKYLLYQQYEAAKASRGAADGFRGNQYTDGDLVKGQNDPLPKRESTRQRIARENGITDSAMKRAISVSKGLVAADEVVPGLKNEILSGTINPTDQAIIAVARASPDERKDLTEKLCQPRPSPKRDRRSEKKSTGSTNLPVKDLSEEKYPLSESTDSDESDSELPEEVTSLSISERMASSPDRKNRDTPVEFIIAELADALDGMIFRWDFCLSVNQPNALLEECQRQVRELATKGINYLRTHQGARYRSKLRSSEITGSASERTESNISQGL